MGRNLEAIGDLPDRYWGVRSHIRKKGDRTFVFAMKIIKQA
ncbi:hypothetical protein QUA30_19820 [Microcoleus sp. Pol14C2]